MSPLTPVSPAAGIRASSVPAKSGASLPKGGKAATVAPRGADGIALSSDAQRVLSELKAIDAKVRAHEAAHLAAGAGLVRGGASFSYVRGPDGKQYAVAGEVAIDTGGVPGDPKATLAKAEQIQAAALAPSDPSPQDRAVAAAASALAAQAQAELSRQGPDAGNRPAEPGSEGAKGLLLDLMA